MKDFLGYENTRHKQNAVLYTRYLERAAAILEPKAEIAILIGHHLTFELNKDIRTEDEIPAADTMIFDHDLARAVFGPGWRDVLVHLALMPREARDEEFKRAFQERMTALRADELFELPA